MEGSVGVSQRESSTSIRGTKRIFGGARVDASNRGTVEQPQCLFHKERRITKFCECRECTLPLCDICEPIHLSEHEKQGTLANLDNYLNSKERAQQDLQSYIRRCRQGRDSIMAVLLAQKNQIEQTVSTFFEEFVAQVEAMTLNEDRLFELERREEKITKGSVKAVIQHYAETYPVVRFPKLNISFSAATLTATLESFTRMLPEGEINSRPSSSHEIRQGVQNNRALQNIQVPVDAQRQAEINRQLIYSPKPLPMQQVGIRPFAHIEQQALSPHQTQTHHQQTTPVQSSTTIQPRMQQVHHTPVDRQPLDIVSPIQKLNLENTQTKPSERNIHYDIVERKENVDQNRQYGQGYIYLHSQPQPVNNNKNGLQVNTQIISQSNQMLEPLGSFRPHSNSRPANQSLESKDWKTVIDTVQINRNASRSSLQVGGVIKTLQDDKRLTDKILSPQEIKAMLGKRANTRDDTQQTRTYTVHHQEVRHAEVPVYPPQSLLGMGMELKQSYFDHQAAAMNGQNIEHRISSFSPEFNNQYREPSQKLQTQPVEIKVFKPIEPTEGSTETNGTYARLYDQAEYQQQNRPTEPYQFRYIPTAAPRTVPLSVNDLRPGTPRLDAPPRF